MTVNSNRIVTSSGDAFLACVSLPMQKEDLDGGELSGVKGGFWAQVVRWAITTVVGFEAGYQYGKIRDGMSGGDDQPETTEARSLSFQTAAPDNTNVQ